MSRRIHWNLGRSLATLLLCTLLAGGGLIWQSLALRGQMVSVLDRQLAAARHRVPTPAELAAVRADFEALQAALAWRQRAAAALGLLALGLGATLALGRVVRPRRSPVAEAAARLSATLEQACRLAAQLNKPISDRVDH